MTAVTAGFVISRKRACDPQSSPLPAGPQFYGRRRPGGGRITGPTRGFSAALSGSTIIGPDVDAKLWEIAENLHRAELTVQERSEHVAEWVRLAEQKQSAQLAPKGHRPRGGMNDAARELKLTRQKVRRAVKIDSIIPQSNSSVALFVVREAQGEPLPGFQEPLALICEVIPRRREFQHGLLLLWVRRLCGHGAALLGVLAIFFNLSHGDPVNVAP